MRSLLNALREHFTRETVLSGLLGCGALLAPAKGAVVAVCLLPVIDLVLGFLCAVKAKRPLFLWHRAGRTMGKILLYEIATILAFITETWMTGPMVPMLRIATGMIGMRELAQCLKHLDELGGQPLFETILTRIAPEPPNPPNRAE